VVDNQYLFGDKLLIPVGVDDGASSPLSATQSCQAFKLAR
jgi:hypothetical protein